MGEKLIDLTHDRPLVVGRSTNRHVAQVATELLRHCDVVAVLTDDRDRLAELPPNIVVVEPQELLPRGVTDLEPTWERGVERWLEQLFPGSIARATQGRILWTETFALSPLSERIQAVAVADAVFGRLRPSRLVMVGRPPDLCETIECDVRRRGSIVEQAAGDRVRRRYREARAVVRGAGLGAALIGRHLVRAIERMRARRRVRDDLAPVTRDLSPRIWVCLSSRWKQSTRHIAESLFAPAAASGTAIGVALQDFGEPVPREHESLRHAERALADGTLNHFRASALVNLSGPDDSSSLLRVTKRWLPIAARNIWSCLRHCGSLEVAGRPASSAADLDALLRVAVYGSLKALEAEWATEQFLARHRDAQVMLFNHGPSAPSKVASIMLRRAGVHTVDYPHAFVGEPDFRDAWQSETEWVATWTLQEAERYMATGRGQKALGGYLPRPVHRSHRRRARRDKRRILIATSYLVPDRDRSAELRSVKHARRLAAALSALSAAYGDRVELVLRPHPLEERGMWKTLLGTSQITFSSGPTFSDDIEDCDLAIITISSVLIEALFYGIPILLHRGPVVEASSLFGQIPARRWFHDAASLLERVHPLIEGDANLDVEQGLLAACFGSPARLRAISSLLVELSSDNGGIAMDASPVIAGR